MAHLLVAGGGIGGLSAALACADAGAQVSLFERAAEFSEVGAGIQLGPNVTRVLAAWGLRDALASLAAFPERLQVRSAQTGVELGVLPLGDEMVAHYGAPYASIHRADLHGLLVQVLCQRENVKLHLHSPVTGVTSSDSGVRLALSDVNRVQGDLLTGVTSSDSGVRLALSDVNRVQGDLLVAADGGWSTLRQQLLKDGTPQPTGHLAYRAMVPQSELPAALRSQQVTAWLGPRMHVVQYPVRGGEWLNVVAIVHGQVQGDMSHWDHSANAQDLQRAMATACTPLQDVIRAIDHWRLWPLSIRPPMRSAREQAQGRVAFLGDAAHPMVPYLAQGAAMAIEDAATLAKVLSEGGLFGRSTGPAVDVPALLRRYAELRWQRNAQVQARAIRNGKIFHAIGPIRWGRNLSMRLLGTRLLDQPWLYGGGPLPWTPQA